MEKALSEKGVNIFTSTEVAEVKKDCISFTDGTCQYYQHGHLDGGRQAFSLYPGSGSAQERRLDIGGLASFCQRECLCHGRL
ncbi:MAG: hypothetical protein NTX42_05720 [Methanothrix sp.]|nr:hypothetical protein [Methanothrix sp.]